MKRKAIIVDLDSTLFNIDHRIKYIDGSLGKKDWQKFYDEIDHDKINHWCWEILKSFTSHNVMFRDVQSIPHIYFIFITGRPEGARLKTVHQIDNFSLSDEYIYMRKDGDFRPDFEVKKEIYHNDIKSNFDILFCLEDRKQVVDMYRAEGLTVLHCADGEY